MATARMMGMRASWLGMALAGVLAFMLLPSPAKGFLMGQGFTYTPVINPVISSGHVMARAQVVGPNGGPILVKVRSSGAGGQSSTVEVEEIGEAYAGGPLEGVYVLSGSAYRDVLRQLAQLRARYPERMARAEFLPAQQLASGLSLADGSSSPGVTLPDHIKTVVVWGRQDRLSPETEAHILLSAPFQLDAGTSLTEDVSSLLMNPDGSIRSLAHGSGVGGDSFDVESFTWRTAFYAQPGSTEQSDRRVDRNEDTIFGPISTAILEQVGWFGTMYAVTDADGYYFMNSPMLCMRNSFGGYLLPGMDTNLILTVSTVPFNPNRMGIPPYYELRDVYAGCSDNVYPYRLDFLIDVLWLVGELHLSNTPGGAAIPVGSNVSYEGQDRSGEPTVRVWDYDGDGEPDTAILANKVTVTDPETGESFIIAEPASDGAYQAVYFSSGTRDQNAEQLADRVPDLWRLADRTLDGRPSGLLTEISEDALRHTDVYIFRESTGELLVEVSGLPEGPYAGRASRIENNAYLWHTLLRGRESIRNNFAAYGTSSGSLSRLDEDAFRERSEELGFSSRYQSRDADMPSPGEMLHVVAVNRVTGYTGSVRFELGAANSPGGAQQRVPALELLPPNVRVWAQRLTEIEAGLTAGEQREYLISHEGAHTANDLIVGLYTDWRAADGSPLPNALGQVRGADFGLTGRLAKVRDGQLVPVTAGQALDSSITLEDALAAGSQGAVAEFPIGPGQNLQLLRLPNTETAGNEHYYVNLFGRALNKEICSHCQYDQAGMHPTLAGRPNHFAPVFVPRYDQESTDAEREAAIEWARENDQEIPDTPAHHQWTLRPEYQFSQLDFQVKELSVVHTDEEGNEVSRNLLDASNPVITSSDDLIRALYSLVLPGTGPLAGFDGERQYVLALGEEEIVLTVGEEQSLDMGGLEHLSQLAAEDYLTMRLYLSHDPDNVLWEWAFDYLYIVTLDDNKFNEMPLDAYYVFADDPVVNLGAALSSDFLKALEDRDPAQRLVWWVEGEGVLEKSFTDNKQAVVGANSLVMPTTAGATGTVHVTLLGEDGDSEMSATFGPVTVLPAGPAYVQLSLSGSASVQGGGEIVATAQVRDAYSNKVMDGTPVNFWVEGLGRLEDIAYITRDGEATATLKGGFLPEPDGKVFATAGESIVSQPFATSQVGVTLDSPPNSVTEDNYHTLVLQVTGSEGNQEGVYVDFSTTRGKLIFAGEGVKSDANGEIRYLWHTGWGAGDATLTARIGSEQLLSHTVTVESHAGTGPGTVNMQTDDALLVADRSSPGSVAYNGYQSGQSGLSFPYQSSQEVNLEGAPFISAQVTLGSRFYPNRQPRLLLSGGTLRQYGYQDDMGRYRLRQHRLTQVQDHPSRLGRALSFVRDSEDPEQSSTLYTDDTALSLPDHWLLRMQMKLTNAQPGAELLRLGNGIVLQVAQGNTLEAVLETDNGPQSLTTASFANGAWQTLVIEGSSNSLSIEVNGASVSAPLIGPLTAAAGQPVLMLGGFTGKVADIGLYDMASVPLIRHASGEQVQTVALNGEGEAAVTVHASGAFRAGPGKQSLLVGVQVGDSEGVINLITHAEYQELASLAYDVLGSEQSFERFRTLYSGSGRNGTEHLLEEKLLAFTLDHNNLDVHVDGYKELTGLKGVLSILRRLEEARPIIPHIERLITYFEVQSTSEAGSAMMYAAADLLYGHIQPRLKGQPGRIDEALLPMLIIGEMLDTVPQAVDRIASTIVTAEDFKIWMRYLSLPAEGWVGLEPPVPPLQSRCGDSDGLMVQTDTPEVAMPLLPCRLTGQKAGTFVNLLFETSPEVAANPTLVPPMLDDQLRILPIADLYLRKYWFGGVLQGDGLVGLHPALGIQEAHAAFPVIPIAIIIGREIAKRAAKAAVVAGAKKVAGNVIGFMLGRSNSRVPPILLMGMMAYLEDRASEECAGRSDCVPVGTTQTRAHIKDVIGSLQTKLMTNILTRGEFSDTLNKQGQLQCGFTYQSQGAAFEILVASVYHMLYEFGGQNPNFQITDMQVRNEISLHKPKGGTAVRHYNEEKSEGNIELVATFTRYTDIQVKGSGDKPLFIEVKSYPAHTNKQDSFQKTALKSTIDRKFPVWSRKNIENNKGTTVHRQLILDAVAASPVNYVEGQEGGFEQNTIAGDFLWYFQDWPLPDERKRNKRFTHPGNAVTRVRMRDSNNETAFEYLRENRLAKLGPNNETWRLLAWNLGREKAGDTKKTDHIYNFIRPGESGVRSKVKVFSLLALIGQGAAGEDGPEGIDAETMKASILAALGIDEPTLDMLSDAEKYQEAAMEHINQMRDKVIEQMARVPGIEDEDLKKLYEEVMNEIDDASGRISELYAKAEEKLIDIAPAIGEPTCL